MGNNFSGIYVIVNKANEKRYVGSAVNIHQRWLRHKNELCLGIHHNRHLLNAWNKYGEDNFSFEVLERVDNKFELVTREQYYSDLLSPEYNINTVVDSPMIGRKHYSETKEKISQSHMGIRPNEETRIKLRDSHKGFKIPEETKRKMSEATKGKYRGWADKEVLQYSRDGVLVNRFKSTMDAERATGIFNTAISRCALGKRPTANGFIWRYSESQ